VDDNLAINLKRTKSLLRDIVAAGAQLHWVGQISANLLRDEELVDLIAESGGKWIFIGLESIDPANLASLNKDFSKPAEYAAVLERLARRNVYAITSFIVGLDHDLPGIAGRTLRQIREWPPVLPVFGQITAFPGTPLYARLAKEGRLTRPRHWLDFAPFFMAHRPLRMTIPEVQSEVAYAWKDSYSPAATRRALEAIRHQPVPYRISHLIARLFFRGIYFPHKGPWGWLKLIARNWRAIFRLIRDALRDWPGGARAGGSLEFEAPRVAATPPPESRSIR
jgi:radical SAM superfamily enzyme YgiQ (UPF0313 family)